ncbi:hypothetical protein QVD17_03818 [Tagetes erecta]|uniref:GRAM domain-containing protein n=1 Tax=Tagetes erecta TaxID=13708 RepID=A0AAD8PA96_TARER|nr:hypothetical protein QVD17_03818 [Tagetes erecta]
MDNRLSAIVMIQPHYLFSTSKSNCIERKDSFAALITNYGMSLGTKLIEIVKHKLSYGAKILSRDLGGKTCRKKFCMRDSEELLHATQCCIYTTAGAIAGTLFVSTERVGFCSNRSLKMHSNIGEVLKFQYKISIPLEKIKRSEESMNLKKPSNKYVELVTVDDFNFWFLGFKDYKKTLRYIHETFTQYQLLMK